MATQTIPTPQQNAADLLPQVNIAYRKEGDDFIFTVTKDDGERSLTYHTSDKRWQCDCDQFDGTTCLHVELVKRWRRLQKEGNGSSAPPPPGNAAAPPPKTTSQSKHGTAQSQHRKGRAPAPAAPASAFPTPATGVSAWTKEVAEALLAPFPAEMVGWKAQATSKDGARAMAVAYVDARAVMDRLDETVGPENWSDSYIVLGEQTGNFGNEVIVACRLTVLGITKEDVGQGDDAKSAFSDAFKRAAVKFGVSRYLYSIDKRWVAYDAQKKQLKEMPQLPPWAVPMRR